MNEIEVLQILHDTLWLEEAPLLIRKRQILHSQLPISLHRSVLRLLHLDLLRLSLYLHLPHLLSLQYRLDRPSRPVHLNGRLLCLQVLPQESH